MKDGKTKGGLGNGKINRELKLLLRVACRYGAVAFYVSEPATVAATHPSDAHTGFAIDVP